ncbi:MAG: hypothetical protein ACOYXN_13605 [Acidobacteriota bacterium]
MKYDIFLGERTKPNEVPVAARDVADGEAVAVLDYQHRPLVIVTHPERAVTALTPYFAKGATLTGWAGPLVPGLPKVQALRLVPKGGSR